MGLFEHFPYTNFHELNLDWLLKTVKSTREDVDKLLGENIQEAINQRIDELITGGQFTDLLEQAGVQMQNMRYEKVATISRDIYGQSVVFDNGYYYVLYGTKIRKYTNGGGLEKEIDIAYSHPNSMTMFNNELWIAVGTDKLYVYNTNLEIMRNISVTVGDCWFIACDEYFNKLYILANNAVYDISDGTFVKICALPSMTVGTDNGFGAYRGNFYFSQSNPNNMYCFDARGKIIKTLPISEYQSNIYSGEMEDFNIDKQGNLYQISIWSYFNNDYRFTQIFHSNVVSGVANGVSTPTTIWSQVLYVDASNKNINPDGSNTNPFPTIAEAIGSLRATGFFYNRISVANGTYNENIVSQFDLNLYGESMDGTIINGYVDCNRSRTYLASLTVKPDIDHFAFSSYQGCAIITQCKFVEPNGYKKKYLLNLDWTAEGSVVQFCTFTPAKSSNLIAPVYNNSYSYLSSPVNVATSSGTINCSNQEFTIRNINANGVSKTLTTAEKNILTPGTKVEIIFDWYNYDNIIHEYTVPGETWTLRLNPIIMQTTSSDSIAICVVTLAYDGSNVTATLKAYNYDLKTSALTQTQGYVTDSKITVRKKSNMTI